MQISWSSVNLEDGFNAGPHPSTFLFGALFKRSKPSVINTQAQLCNSAQGSSHRPVAVHCERQQVCWPSSWG